MKTILFIATICALATSMSFLGQDGHGLDHGAMFQEFKETYGKYYDDEEEMLRFQIFRNNLEVVRKLNEDEQGSATYGVTQFMDMTQEDFAATYRNLKVPENTDDIPKFPVIHDIEGTVPDKWDWRDHGAVTPVKNQGGCGSCWAFSAVANLEGQYFLKNKELKSFSEQELVDCDRKTDEGCNGGLMQDAFKFFETTGFELEKAYPYTGMDGTCSATKHTQVGEVKSYHMVSTDETVIKNTLYSVGPLSIALNATPMQFYMGGVSDPWSFLCNPESLDHGVTLVGYGSEKNLWGTTKDYWLIKNSWGSMWGESGYYKLVRGKGACGVNRNVVTAQL